VALGGALYSDIPSDLPRALHHACSKEELNAHSVEVEPDSRLAQALGATHLWVNSRHHQAIRDDRVGRDLRIVARAPDGVIEGVESSVHTFVMGVQWHPEEYVNKDNRFLGLFAAFVVAARRQRAYDDRRGRRRSVDLCAATKATKVSP